MLQHLLQAGCDERIEGQATLGGAGLCGSPPGDTMGQGSPGPGVCSSIFEGEEEYWGTQHLPASCKDAAVQCRAPALYNGLHLALGQAADVGVDLKGACA